MRKTGFAAALMIVVTMSCGAFAADPAPRPADAGGPAIDVVFCIDCSGSMGGVIETAKQKVWAIVNEVAKAKPSPVLRIGLIGYGNGMGPFRSFPLSDDLDGVYKNLMTFKDEGWGDEFVGLAIRRATDDMKWADGKQVLKVIYVVGNETARQGPAAEDYAVTAPAAIAKGIVVNAIYCGTIDPQVGPATWREFAKLADGTYMEIAGQGGAIVLATPFDDELAALNAKLNGTYVAYGGARGAAQQENQSAQDGNAGGFGNAVLADRVAAKASAQYRNSSWDLVDASKDAKFDLASVKDQELPEAMRKMSPDERKEYLVIKSKERQEIQAQIHDQAAKRDAYVKEEIAKRGLEPGKALDEAVRKSISEQAKKKGFEFDPAK